MFYVYVVANPVGQFYIGHTVHLDHRIEEHNFGKTLSTRGKGPWQLVHSEEYATRSEAMKREKQLKGGQGREWIKKTFFLKNSSAPSGL